LEFSKKSSLTSRWPFFFNFFTKKLKKVKKKLKKLKKSIFNISWWLAFRTHATDFFTGNNAEEHPSANAGMRWAPLMACVGLSKVKAYSSLDSTNPIFGR
jgi:hypothetical protein